MAQEALMKRMDVTEEMISRTEPINTPLDEDVESDGDEDIHDVLTNTRDMVVIEEEDEPILEENVADHDEKLEDHEWDRSDFPFQLLEEEDEDLEDTPIIREVHVVCDGELGKCKRNGSSSSFWDDDEDMREQVIEEIQTVCNEELEEYKEDDNEYLIETSWEDESHIPTLVIEDIKCSIYKDISEIVVPPKDMETLQNCCAVMKYLCQETNSKHLNTKVEEVIEEEPLMLKSEDFSSGIIGVEKVEVVGGETPFYLFPPQAYKFRRRRSLWGHKQIFE